MPVPRTVKMAAIKNFKEVGEGIFRGAQPHEEDFAFLKSLGIKNHYLPSLEKEICGGREKIMF